MPVAKNRLRRDRRDPSGFSRAPRNRANPPPAGKGIRALYWIDEINGRKFKEFRIFSDRLSGGFGPNAVERQ